MKFQRHTKERLIAAIVQKITEKNMSCGRPSAFIRFSIKTLWRSASGKLWTRHSDDPLPTVEKESVEREPGDSGRREGLRHRLLCDGLRPKLR